MEIPKRLEEWTLARIKALLKAGTFEDETFDFKERLPHPSDDKGKHRLRKSIVAFANSGGGFLVFGIKDDRSLTAEDRIVGVPNSIDLPQQFGHYPSCCQPSVEWAMKTPALRIPDKDAVIHVFEILSTWRKPHAVLENGAAYFVKRTNQGDEPMSYGEIKSAFQEAEFRRTSLALLVSELEHICSVADNMVTACRSGDLEASPDKPHTWATRYSTTLLDVTLGSAYPFLTADPELWKYLSTIREHAWTSNALCEGFTSAVFFRIGQRVAIHDSQVRAALECAREIVRAAKEAVERLKKLQ